ncbi:MAG TPA: outer membrane lipoprotein-sorting protein, partial [Treponemataceae bacterium]|nr:outer membrane lipoprotein-sorting protein [Treponemataceae bacterium]
IDERLYVARKAILYSAAGKPLRELLSSDIRQVGGKNVPFRSVMRDLLKRNSKTEMNVLSMKIGVQIEARYFSREELSW